MSPPTFCVTLTPSFAKPLRTIENARSTLKSVEVGVRISYCIGCAACAFAPVVAGTTRMPSEPRLYPSWSSAVLAAAQSYGSGPRFGFSSSPEMCPTRLSTLRRVAREDDVDDLVAVDAHRERPLHRRVEELAVLRLRRVRVPGDVGRLGARDRGHDGLAALLHGVDRLERHLVGPVELAALEVGDHRVGVRVVRQRDARGGRRRAVEVG